MAELKVAGWFVSPLTKKLADKALSYAGDQYKWFKGPANSLNCIASSLTRIQAASRSVERQQTQDTHHQAWLQQLRDAIYEIEDLLDEFSYLALKSAIQPKFGRYLSNSGRTVKRIFGMDKPITKLQSLLLKLDAIEESYKSLVSVATLEAFAPLVSFVPAEDVMIGRDVEYQGLLSRLIDSPGPSRGDSSIPVIAVVGAAGMGKTSITQFAFNDPAVEERFEMMMWVTVPKKFHEADLTRKIINYAENDVCAGPLNFGGLQQVLKRMVKSKRFLLVLDNVWHKDNETLQEGGLYASTCADSIQALCIRQRDAKNYI